MGNENNQKLIHEEMMRRCLALAKKGYGKVGFNPMVGSVLVKDGQVIAEGWHAGFGEDHAERMLLESLPQGAAADLSNCTLYVSLEPCCFVGKTPACTDIIIDRFQRRGLDQGLGQKLSEGGGLSPEESSQESSQAKLSQIVVGAVDPNPRVSGKGIKALRDAGMEVVEGILAHECRQLNAKFWVNQLQHRCYVVGKWAETGDGYMGGEGNERLMISGDAAKGFVRNLRIGADAVVIGVNTWQKDQPLLTIRPAEPDVAQPIRIILDRGLNGIYTQENVGRSQAPLWVIYDEMLIADATKWVLLKEIEQRETGFKLWGLGMGGGLKNFLKWLYVQGLGSVLVEGGAEVMQSFLDADLVDELHVLRNPAMVVAGGVKSPNHKLQLERQADIGGNFGVNINFGVGVGVGGDFAADTNEHWYFQRLVGV